jgi:hypothetical protein
MDILSNAHIPLAAPRPRGNVDHLPVDPFAQESQSAGVVGTELGAE